MKQKFLYYFYYLIGGISLILGIIGVFLPVLPTTPFLLLSSYCYLKSSKKTYNWIINNPVLGTYIKNYLEHKGIRRKDRIKSITILWAMLLTSIYFSKSNHLKLFLFAVGIGVSIHLCLIKSVDE